MEYSVRDENEGQLLLLFKEMRVCRAALSQLQMVDRYFPANISINVQSQISWNRFESDCT